MIRVRIRSLNVAGALLAVIVFVFALVSTEGAYIFTLTYNILVMISLVFVVIHMRKTIKAT